MGALPARGNNNNGAAAFQIFSETIPSSSQTGHDASSSHSSLAENPHWNHLAPDQQRRKENDGPVTVWTDRPLINNQSAVSVGGVPSSTSTVRPLLSMVPIFVDEAFQQPQPTTTEPPSSQSQVGSIRTGGGLSIRRQLDGEERGREGGADLGRIAANPLERHKQSSAVPSSQPPPPPAQVEPSAASTSTSTSASISASTNAPTSISISSSAPLSSITIFEDVPPPITTTKKPTTTTSSSSSSTTAPPPSHLPVATKRLTHPANAGTSTGGSTTIGKTTTSSSSSSSSFLPAAAAPATTVSLGFAIFEENPLPPPPLSVAGGGVGEVGNSREGGGGGKRSQGMKPLALSSSSQPVPLSTMPLSQQPSQQQPHPPRPQPVECSPVFQPSRPRHMTSSSSSSSVPQDDQEDEVEAMLLAMGLPSSGSHYHNHNPYHENNTAVSPLLPHFLIVSFTR